MAANKQKTEKQKLKGISKLTLIVAMLVAFAAGTRFSSLADYFFSPYTNHSNQILGSKLTYDQTNQIYKLLKQKFDGNLDGNKLEDGLSKGLVEAAGDPYTVYLNAKDAEAFQNDLDGTISGIGAELASKNNRIVVVAPLDGSPAKAAGLKSGDVIVKINNEDATTLSVDAAVDKIHGEAGSKVTLGLMRGNESISLTITRAQITVPSVKSEILDGDIGYLQITRFGSDTSELATKAAKDFKDKKVKGVIVDVRNNGGGLLDSAVHIAGLWLNNKVVVSERTGGKVTSQQRTGNNPLLAGIPTTMLINGGSASASEILAGALHDNHAAKLIGEKSFGKGSVQEIINLNNGAQLKVTVAHWYTPGGINIDKKGIQPDEKVTLTTDDFNNNRDPQKDKALSEL